jgi:transglutaminase-like putative cysteine protease
MLTGCAALTLHRALGLSDLLPVVAVAILGPTLLIGLATPRLSTWLTAPLSTVVWLVAALLYTRPYPATLRDALTTAGPDLLTTILPTQATRPLLVAVSAVVWVTASASAELAARTGSALAPALPPVLLFLLGLLVGVGGSGSDTALAAGFVALAAMLAVVRRPPAVRVGWRRYFVAAAVAAIVVGAGFLVGPRIPHGQPFDPRRYAEPVGQPQAAASPLDQVSAWLATPDLSLFTASGSSDVDWRIGSLDAFDGQTWSSTGRFVPTGGRVPGAAGGRAVAVSTVVTVTGLTGSWVPTVESPVAVSGPKVVVDPTTGVLLAPDGLAPGLRYAVDARVPQYDADQLRSAVPADDAPARAALALPAGLPPAIVDIARSATEGATFPVQQATRLASYLRQIETNDPSAPPGHSYGHLLYFLTESHRGTTEQFGAAFAVMARALGLPTRLAVGFGPGLPGPDGLTTVRGGDALVWPEVDFAGIGWVPFYPTPATGTDGDGPGLAAGASGARREVDDTLDATTPTQPSNSDSASAPPAKCTAGPGQLWWTPIAGLAVAYLLSVLVAPPLRRWRRRRAARDGSTQVAAAWAELLRLLRPLRLGDMRTLTTVEVAAAGTERLGPAAGTRLVSLAAAADAAAFGSVGLSDESGLDAWRLVNDVAPVIRRTAGLVKRLGYRLILR